VELAVRSRERAPDVYRVVDVVPQEAEHLFPAEAEPERQVDRRIPRIGSCHCIQDRTIGARPAREVRGGPQAAPKTNTAYLSGSPLARESAPSLTK
jgi:hypothetical protein